MCDECGVAEQLATAVGVEYTPPPPPPHPPPSQNSGIHLTSGIIVVILFYTDKLFNLSLYTC